MTHVEVFLKSGQSVKFKCESAEFTWDKTKQAYTGYRIIDSNPSVHFVPDQIAAWHHS